MSYTTIRRLGRGATGVVDLARDEDGHEVALKRLSFTGTPEELASARQRLQREVEVLRTLDHPAIVGLLDVYEDGDDLVLVMDHLEGGNLAQRVRDHGPLGATEVRQLGDRLLSALASAHRSGVVHRDIKPANVLFDLDGNPALADFGSAVHRDITAGLTASEMVVGTPGFMAPEQARGDEVTSAADVFSLGATLQFAATGEGPFGTGDPRVLMLRAAAGRTEKLPRHLPLELRRWLSAMTDPDPARRPTAAASVSGPAGTDPVPVVRRSRKWLGTGPRPAPTAAAVGAALAIVLLAGAATVLIARDTGGGPLREPQDLGPLTETTTSSVAEDTCIPLPYQPCGQRPAANTDGVKCIDGHGDYDGDPANGCEAEPDDNPDGMELRGEVTGNIVPADDVDDYSLRLVDNFQLRCDGRATITITSPEGAIHRVTAISEDGAEMATAISSSGTPGVIVLREPNCFHDDTTTVTIRVQGEPGATPTSDRYTLTASGSY